MEFWISNGGKVFSTESLTFPGGELHVTIPGLPERLDDDLAVTVRLQSPDDLIRLVLATEILGRAYRGFRRLVIPYFPYARQDRVTEPHVAFSLKPIASIVNSLCFDEVVVCDPHSDVTTAFLSNVHVITQDELVESHEALQDFLYGEAVVIVAPDAGAEKKSLGIARQYGKPLVTASKARDVSTGQITQTQLHGDVAGLHALIIDDICDGGRTFVELAKVLREAGAASVRLYVTHGIFSKGVGVFHGLIDAVYTTDSFLSRDVETPHQSPVPLYVSPINQTLEVI